MEYLPGLIILPLKSYQNVFFIGVLMKLLYQNKTPKLSHCMQQHFFSSYCPLSFLTSSCSIYPKSARLKILLPVLCRIRHFLFQILRHLPNIFHPVEPANTSSTHYPEIQNTYENEPEATDCAPLPLPPRNSP